MYYERRVIGDLYLVKKTVQLQFANRNYTKYHASERRVIGDLKSVWMNVMYCWNRIDTIDTIDTITG